METQNGFMPVAIFDIECAASDAIDQAEIMSALFRTIGRLTDDKEIVALCAHGALQADLQGDDIDVLRKRAVKAGMVGTGPQSEQ
jgi:hypothetical protein